MCPSHVTNLTESLLDHIMSKIGNLFQSLTVDTHICVKCIVTLYLALDILQFS